MSLYLSYWCYFMRFDGISKHTGTWKHVCCWKAPVYKYLHHPLTKSESQDLSFSYCSLAFYICMHAICVRVSILQYTQSDRLALWLIGKVPCGLLPWRIIASHKWAKLSLRSAGKSHKACLAQTQPMAVMPGTDSGCPPHQSDLMLIHITGPLFSAFSSTWTTITAQKACNGLPRD